MPLKHHTETALVALLCVLIVLTGIALSTLPILPDGIVPWGIVFVVTLLYPLALYPLLRKNRADYEFRALHFAPAVIAGLWIILQAASLRAPLFLRFHHWLTWGHAFFPVTVALVLLTAFCLHVIRRREVRLGILLAIFLPFVLLAAATESGGRLDQTLASALWGSRPEQGTGSLVAVTNSSASVPGMSPGSGKNLETSADADEEAWRARLRAVESKSGAVLTSSGTVVSSLSPSSTASSVAPVIAAKPRRLPSSGFGMEVLAPMFAAASAGMAHRRAKKRA